MRPLRTSATTRVAAAPTLDATCSADVLGRLVRCLRGLDARLGLSGRRRVGRNSVQALVLIAAERVSEVPKPPSERAAYLGQTLWPEHQQRDHQHEQQVCGLEDVAYHAEQLSLKPSGALEATAAASASATAGGGSRARRSRS